MIPYSKPINFKLLFDILNEPTLNAFFELPVKFITFFLWFVQEANEF